MRLGASLPGSSLHHLLKPNFGSLVLQKIELFKRQSENGIL